VLIGMMLPYIGSLELDKICDDCSKTFIAETQKIGHGSKKPINLNTVKRAMAKARRILNLAARSWRSNRGPDLCFRDTAETRSHPVIAWSRGMACAASTSAAGAPKRPSTYRRRRTIHGLRWHDYPSESAITPTAMRHAPAVRATRSGSPSSWPPMSAANSMETSRAGAT